MRKKVNKKLIVALLSFVLLFGGTFGSSLAWLLDNTEDVTNTFTTSDINIELSETTTNFEMVPGHTIDKDPVVTVKAGSEDCWVFIEVFESENLDEFISYAIDENNWTKLTTGDDREVWYTYSNDVTADRNIKILGGGKNDEYSWESQQVLTNPTVTKEMMETLKVQDAEQPTLTFTAYATQYWKDNNTAFTPQEAWELVKDLAD